MERFQINEEVLTAYLKGELDPAQITRVEEWYDASPANRKMLGEVYYLLFINDRLSAAEQIDVERSLRELKARMHARRPKTGSGRRIAWRVAAAAVIAVAAVTGFRGISSVAERLSKPVMISTQLGERSQVVLPDGTKVWLNSCSRVEYSSPLFSRKRQVSMDGEAYFEVAHNKNAPFIVEADGLNVQVLGTRFNIRCNDDKHCVTTVLFEGSVMAYAVGSEHENIHLRPSQAVYFNTQTKRMTLSDCTDAGNSIDWIVGRLHFNQLPFSEIAAELERYFNVEIVFKNESLRQECFSGDFQVTDGIYHIMSVLGLTYKFRYEIVDNAILLYTKN